MAFDPFRLMQLSQMLETFRQSHPKFPLFFKAVEADALMEGTIIEITAKSPEGTEYCTNLKLNASDVEMLRTIGQMKKQG